MRAVLIVTLAALAVGTSATAADKAAAQKAMAAAIATPADYKIGAQDTLEINVFQVPDLSRTVQVDSGGKILLPLIGQVSAAGRTPGELASYLEQLLGKDYLKDPQVTVAVKDSTSQRVTIDGAVLSPGIYPLAGPTTLMQAVALAKGPDPKLANIRKVAVFHEVGGKRTPVFHDLAAIRSGKAADPIINGGDIVVVDTSGTKSFFANMGSAFPLLTLLRPY
jgi:polysaccharide export outer membrane protein